MKSVGIIREIDKLGRIVIPIEYRHTLGIETGDPVEITAENDRIILRPYTPSCIFCKSIEDTVDYHGKTVCRECLEELKKY